MAPLMISKFDFQRDEVSFFFLLSHLTALPCIRCADDAINIWAVHQIFQNAKLLLSGGGHEILPLLRQDGQIGNAPLDILLAVGIRRCKLHQMANAPAYQIAVALQMTVFAAGRTKDFCVSHRN